MLHLINQSWEGQHKMKNILTTLIAFGILAFGSVANAATVSYFLDQSNELADGPRYAEVTLSDDAVDGDIDITVTVNEAMFDIVGATNFGMQTFSFNYDITGLDGTASIDDIDPIAWLVTNTNGSVSEFGKFDFDLSGDGSSRTTTLSFSITGVVDDTVDNYIVSNNDNPYFASHIAGFNDTACITEEGEGLCNSAYFAGSSTDRGLEPPAVPIPAAAWLFGSGLIGLVGVARRKVTDNNA